MAFLSPERIRPTGRQRKGYIDMLVCCSCDLSDIGIFLQAVVATIALWLAWKKSGQAYKRWENEKAVQHCKFLESLLDKFSRDDIQSFLSLADDSSLAEKWFKEVCADNKKDKESQSSFRFFSYLCYLKDNGLIEDREFCLFEDSLHKILSNESVQKYMRTTMNRLSDGNVVHPFKNLLDYAIRLHVNDDVYMAKGDSHGSGCIAQNADKRSDSHLSEPLTAKELSKYPIAVIRINKLYRQDMTSEELYNATRGWWRVNLDVANKVKYALSVAEGHVKEVYAINDNGWHKYGATEGVVDEGADGRYQFDGEVVNDVSVRRLYVGRSIEGLFTQGDAYPVRYFGIKA